MGSGFGVGALGLRVYLRALMQLPSLACIPGFLTKRKLLPTFVVSLTSLQRQRHSWSDRINDNIRWQKTIQSCLRVRHHTISEHCLVPIRDDNCGRFSSFSKVEMRSLFSNL